MLTGQMLQANLRGDRRTETLRVPSVLGKVLPASLQSAKRHLVRRHSPLFVTNQDDT